MLDLLFGKSGSKKAYDDGWFGGGFGPLAGVGYSGQRTRSQAGVIVDEDLALTYASVWCATRVIAETLASLPLVLYEEQKDGGREEAVDEPLYDTLRYSPNDQMGSMAFREGRTAHQVNWGQGFAEVERRMDGSVQLHPIHPARVRPVRPGDRNTNGDLLNPDYAYLVRNYDGSSMAFRADEMLHVPGVLSDDGVWGKGVVTYARETIGFGLATERHGATYFGSGAQPRGILTTTGVKSAETRRALREEWKRVHGSPDSNDIAIMDAASEFKPLLISNEDSQFLGTRKHNKEEIATWYRLPPHMIGDLSQSTNNNIEHQGMEFVIYSLFSWASRWEEQLTLKLIPPARRGHRPGGLFIEHDFSSLMRGDLQARMSAYQVALMNGIRTLNEVRRLENLSGIGPAGDVHYVALNMTTAERMEEGPPPAPAAPVLGPKPVTTPGGEGSKPNHFAANGDLDAWTRRLAAPPDLAPARLVLTDALTRLFTKEANAATRAAKGTGFDAWLAEFYGKHETHAALVLVPAAAVLTAAGVPTLAPALAAQLAAESQRLLTDAYNTLTPEAFAAALAEWPAGRAIRSAAAILHRAYDPDQPRAPNGEFGEGSDESKDPAERPARPAAGFQSDQEIADHAAKMVAAHEADPHNAALQQARDEAQAEADAAMSRVINGATKEDRVKAWADNDRALADKSKAEAALRQEAQRSFMQSFGVPPGDRADISIKATDGRAGKERIENGDKAAYFLRQVSEKGAIGDRDHAYLQATTDGRAHYSLSTIYTAKGDGPEIHAHEFGHHLEEKADIRERVQTFSKERFGNEPFKDMAAVAPQQGYKAGEEQGRKDDLTKVFGEESKAYYAGKVYSGGRSEVLSMGLEQLYRDPVYFAKVDPKYFSLVTGALQRKS